MLRLKTDADEVTQLAFDGAGLLVVASVPWPDRAAAFAGLVSATAVARYDLESGAEVGRRVCRGSGAVLSPDRSELWFLWSGTQSRRISDVRCRVLATDEETPVHLADEYCVTRLAVSPDGGSLAMGGYDWRVGGLEYVWRLRTRDGSVRPPIRADVSCLGYSPDAALLATGAQSGVTVWPEAGPYRHFAEPATELAWSPDGSLAWTADGDIHVAEPADPGPVRSFERPGELFTALGFSPDGRLLLAGTRGGLVHAFDRRDGLVRSLGWEIGPVHALAFAQDGLTAAAGGERWQVVVWDVDGGWEHDRLSELHEWSLAEAREERVSFVRWAGVFDPGSRWVASAGYQDTAGVEYLVVHDLTATPTRVPPPNPDPEVARLIGGEPSPIFSRLWEYPNVIFEPEFQGRLEGTLAASADGRLLAGSAALWSDGPASDELWVWNVQTGEYRRAPVPARPDTLAFSPDGRWLFGARSGGLDRWDVETLERRTWQRWEGRVGPLRFSPDGTVLAAAAERVVLLDVREAENTPALQGRLPIAAADLAFHPDGRLLTADRDGVVRVWDPASGRELTAFDWSAGPLHTLAVSPDGTTAAAGGEGGRVVVWDLDG